MAAPPAAADADTDAAIAPVPGQLQRFEAELRLRVDDVEALSTATKRAQQIAIQHDGSVASLQYDAPAEGVGGAQITLRIPTARVQSAMSQLSQLGTILGQRYGIEDLQVQSDSLQTQIEQTQRRIAQILTQLESTTLSERGPRRPPVSPRRLQAEAGRPAREHARHERRGAHGDGLPHA